MKLPSLHQSWPLNKKQTYYVFLILIEILSLAYLWWSMFWFSEFRSIFVAATVFGFLVLTGFNNSFVNWATRPTQKEVDNIARRKKKAGL